MAFEDEFCFLPRGDKGGDPIDGWGRIRGAAAVSVLWELFPSTRTHCAVNS